MGAIGSVGTKWGLRKMGSGSGDSGGAGFYRATRMHSTEYYAVARCLSVRPSGRPSVTCRYSVNTAEHIPQTFYRQVGA